MSKTAGCFLALGLSVALAAACGDDSGGGGTAGSGGAGGSGGSAGASGSAGSAGSAGSGDTAGTGGDGASGGTGGSGTGGAGGSGTAGTAGTAGAGGSTVVETDAGADASPDASNGGTGGTAPIDSGVNGNCPTLNAVNVFNAADNSQSGAIAEVIFRGSTADVVIQATDVGGFDLAGAFICTGSAGDGSDTTCQAVSGADAGGTVLAQDQTLTITGVTGVSAVGGELALTHDGDPSGGGFPNAIDAYIAWGTFPTAGGDPLEIAAVAAGAGGFWTADQRIPTGVGKNAIFANPTVGDAGTTSLSLAATFTSCTGDDF